MTNILTPFCNYFIEMIEQVQNVFPEDTDILAAKNALITMRKLNPKLIITVWINYIATPYKQQIENNEIEFFIDKDYSKDLVDATNNGKIIEVINRLRKPVKMMNKEEQQKIMKYIQNLTKLCFMYK
jgi:hypothetical protein